MKEELVTVIVPCYNVEKFLDDCFKSLEAQTYKNVEIIFVNDGSKDETLNILRSYCENKQTCSLIDKPNGGLSSARNAGLEKANGKYVYFFDSDDLIHPQTIDLMVNNIAGADMAVCRDKWTKENFTFEKMNKKPFKKVKIKHFEGADDVMSIFLTGEPLKFSACNKLYKMEIIKSFETWPMVFNPKTKYAEDLEFNTLYIDKSSKINFIAERLYFYRQRKGSLVHSKFNENKLNIFNGLNVAEALDKNVYVKTQDYIKSRRCIMCIEMLFRIYRSDYNNVEVTRKLYEDFKECSKYVFKCKKNPGYLRGTIRLSVPFVRMLLSKKLKRRK